jgi:hypothetical protein
MGAVRAAGSRTARARYTKPSVEPSDASPLYRRSPLSGLITNPKTPFLTPRPAA